MTESDETKAIVVLTQEEIRSRVVRYHDNGVTVVVSRGTDGQL
jgi:hypothetical protein